MESREQNIRQAIQLMLDENSNLTGEGVPELPELKSVSGHDDVTSEERDKWSAEIMGVEEEEESPKTPPKVVKPKAKVAAKRKKKKQEPNTEDTDPEQPVPNGPRHLPTNLYHPEKPTRSCRNMDEWLDAREDGFKNLEEFPPEVAEEIHKRGRDMGLHASQKVRA